MSEFNRMTVVAGAEVVSNLCSHDDMEVYEVQWGIDGKCNTSSKSARAASWAKCALSDEHQVYSENGLVSLARAIVETAIKRSSRAPDADTWRKFVAGLRFDGFEIVDVKIDEVDTSFFGQPKSVTRLGLKRMLPEGAPDLDFREAESEVQSLLKNYEFSVAKGHLKQAMSAFQRGEWAGANAQIRSFFESCLNETADKLGYRGGESTDERRTFLGQLEPPFLLESYNEWNLNKQKPQFVQGLWSRMHPEGSHPGLSEEEDATFRLQITLITARLFLRRYHKRKAVTQ